MRQLLAVLHREGKIRATNLTFIFWDVFYPLAYLMVFGVAMQRAMGFTVPGISVDYNAFFLAGVLAMASFAIASNTAWSFFMDRDNGIFYEMLTYPMSRGQYLFGKVLFNVAVALVQALITVALGTLFLGIPLRITGIPLLFAGVIVGTAGWFFFYAIFALRIRRNDAFNTVTSVFYFIFLFASSMFYPLDPLPRLFRIFGYANPITWQVDILRYATIGLGNASTILLEGAAFVVFSAICFGFALHALHDQE
jgi:ABC-2 type transport system permease protein